MKESNATFKKIWFNIVKAKFSYKTLKSPLLCYYCNYNHYNDDKSAFFSHSFTNFATDSAYLIDKIYMPFQLSCLTKIWIPAQKCN